MLQSAFSSCEEGQGRASGGCSRLCWSSNCRHGTGISVTQLVKSMVVVMMCRKAMSCSDTSDCHQPTKSIEQLKQDAPEALLWTEAHAQRETCSGSGMLQSVSSLCEKGQGRASRGCSRLCWSSNCRHGTGICVRQLVKSMAEVMMYMKVNVQLRYK